MARRTPTITRSQIKKLFDTRTFERGADYARRGAVIEAKQTAVSLAARCCGSAGHRYRVVVSFDSTGPASATCTCPVSAWCKHAAALLLTWVEHPGRFVEQLPLDERLKPYSREQLVMLIAQLLRQFPDADALLDIPPPSPSAAVTSAPFRAQAAAAFERSMHEEWEGGAALREAVLAVAAAGDDFLLCDNPRAAAAVYEGVLQEVEQRLEEIPDLLEELFDIVQACVVGLQRCLGHKAADASVRQHVIGLLLAAVYADIERGGTDAADEAWDALSDDTTPHERAGLVERVEQIARSAKDGWAADAYAHLLAALNSRGK